MKKESNKTIDVTTKRETKKKLKVYKLEIAVVSVAIYLAYLGVKGLIS